MINLSSGGSVKTFPSALGCTSSLREGFHLPTLALLVGSSQSTGQKKNCPKTNSVQRYVPFKRRILSIVKFHPNTNSIQRQIQSKVKFCLKGKFCPKANAARRQIPSRRQIQPKCKICLRGKLRLKGKFSLTSNSVRRQILFEGKFSLKANFEGKCQTGSSYDPVIHQY